MGRVAGGSPGSGRSNPCGRWWRRSEDPTPADAPAVSSGNAALSTATPSPPGAVVGRSPASGPVALAHGHRPYPDATRCHHRSLYGGIQTTSGHTAGPATPARRRKGGRVASVYTSATAPMAVDLLDDRTGTNKSRETDRPGAADGCGVHGRASGVRDQSEASGPTGLGTQSRAARCSSFIPLVLAAAMCQRHGRHRPRARHEVWTIERHPTTRRA